MSSILIARSNLRRAGGYTFKSTKEHLLNFLKSDVAVAFFLLGIFLCTHGYRYGWDDQHYEIPLLKGLIDPTLYAGDYFVETLKTNFTSYLYHILSKLITLEQIPGVFFALYLISRYFLFFWGFKIWSHISASRVNALASMLTVILVWRTEEFLYRSFSHQEFTLAFVFAGIYFFYKERFIWAALIFGVATNFHALYSLYPMFFLLTYLAWQIRKHGFKILVLAGLAYLLASLPFLIWTFKRVIVPGINNGIPASEWIPLYHLTCPQNFVFLDIPLSDLFRNWPATLLAFKPYLPCLAFLCVNLLHNPIFRRDKKVISVALGSLLLLVISFVFTYIYPYRLVLDLNLIWSIQYLQFFLSGYTALLIFKKAQEEWAGIVFFAAVFFSLVALGNFSVPVAGGLILLLFLIPIVCRQKNLWFKLVNFTLIALAIALCLKGILFLSHSLANPSKIFLKFLATLTFSSVLLIAVFIRERGGIKNAGLRKTFIFIPIVIMFFSYVQYHQKYLKSVKSSEGYWRLQNDWEDMQRWAKNNTPKDALFLTPYDTEMGGFRVFSERKVICCYRDCGIIGFDYKAGREWFQRVSDIWAFKVALDGKSDFQTALQNAMIKYQADYIVFMRYYAPNIDFPYLQKIYENDTFCLFKVAKNPS